MAKKEPREAPDGAGSDHVEIVPGEGERGLIVGQTGSGKTALATWMNERRPRAPILIYDTKGDPKFERMPRSAVTPDEHMLGAMIEDPELDYVIWRPDVRIAHDTEKLDDVLLHHYDNWQADAYLDELRSFCTSGRAGPGLMALYTRGRSRGISTVGGVQRPAWVSRDAMSEAQHFYIFDMVDQKDRKRMAEIVPGFDQLPRVEPPHFYYWRRPMERPRLMRPVPLDPRYDTGYIDAEVSPESGTEDGAPAAPKHVWL